MLKYHFCCIIVWHGNCWKPLNVIPKNDLLQINGGHDKINNIPLCIMMPTQANIT
jgi:hypothetical protein